MPHRLHVSLAVAAILTFVLAAGTSVLAKGASGPAVGGRPPGAALQPAPEQQPAARHEPAAQQPAAPQEPNSPEAPSISGAWTLNHEMSDRQQATVPGGDESGGEGGRGGRRSGMGGGRMGGMRGGGGEGRVNPEAMKEARETMQELMQASERLTITQTPDQVTFTDADGRIRHYSATGKKEKHQLLAGVVETKTVWKEGQLVMESQPEGGGMKVIQTYSIDPKTHQLVVSTAMEGSGRSMPPIRRVYDNVRDVR